MRVRVLFGASLAGDRDGLSARCGCFLLPGGKRQGLGQARQHEGALLGRRVGRDESNRLRQGLKPSIHSPGIHQIFAAPLVQQPSSNRLGHRVDLTQRSVNQR